MIFVAADGNPVGASAQPKRHSPIFLAVFAVFLLATTLCVMGSLLGIILAGITSHDTLCYWISGHLLPAALRSGDAVSI